MAHQRIIIDRRPIFLVILARSQRLIFLSLIALAFYYYVTQPPWPGISLEAYKAIGAFLLCAVLWLSQLIPLAITGLLAVVIIPVLGILPSKEVFSYFGNEAVFFILGAFILSAAIMKTGLSTRLSILLLRSKKMSPRGLAFQILLSTACLSCLMSEHAVAAFFFPIVLEIARALDFEPQGGEYGKTLFLAMAWGCIIGGIVTFLGGARAPLALGIFNEMTGRHINFFDWMKTTLVIAIPLFILAYFLLTRYFKTDITSAENARAVLEQKAKKLGRISFKEIMTALVLIGSIFFWITSRSAGALANVAIVAVVLLFVFRLVSWKDVEEYVNWGVVLMYGGAIALGRAVDSSGALEWLATKIIFLPQALESGLGWQASFWLLAIVSLLAIFFTEVFSNAAVVALLLPVSIRMASSFQIDPAMMTYAIAIPCGLAFLLPMGTPAMAISYSSGYLRVRDLTIPGLMLNFSAWVLFLLVVRFWWPLIGYSL